MFDSIFFFIIWRLNWYVSVNTFVLKPILIKYEKIVVFYMPIQPLKFILLSSCQGSVCRKLGAGGVGMFCTQGN